MSQPTRANSSKKTFSYEPQTAGTLPEEIQGYFNKKGFHLRWVRYQLDGKEDARNVGKRLREGYEPVALRELPEAFQNDFTEDRTRGAEGVVFDDLMLFKVPLEIVQQRNAYFEGKALDVLRAANRFVDSAEGITPQIRQQMPSFDESTSEVVYGQKPRGESRKTSQFGATLPKEEKPPPEE